MLEVDDLVARWRESVAPYFHDREEVLDELESHLLDAIDRLTNAGSSPDEAVRLASERLGMPESIAAEFSKVPPRVTPWLPVRVVGVAGLALTALVLWPLTSRLFAGGVDSLLAAHTGAVLLGYVATFAVGVLGACFLVSRLVAVPDSGRQRYLRRALLWLSALAALLTGGGVAAGVFCPFAKTGWCYGLSTHEVAGLAVLFWDFLLLAVCLACRPGRMMVLLTVLGTAGTALVVFGWFGVVPALLALSLPIAVGGTALVPAGCLRLR